MSDLVPVRIDGAARELLGDMPDAGSRFQNLAFQPLTPTEADGHVAAVDGGHSVVADLGSCGVVGIRAGYTMRGPGDSYEDFVLYDEVRAVARSRAQARWRDVAQAHDWGVAVDPPKFGSGQWVRAWCEAERCLAEYDMSRRALRALRPGDLLLLDGCLDPDLFHPGLLDSVLQVARRQGVHVAGITKDTSLTIGGTLPFTLEVEEAAMARRAPTKFYVDVGEALGKQGPYGTYAVRFDGRSNLYRVDVAAATGTDEHILSRVAALCNDVAYPGYPYPLARVHSKVHYAAHQSDALRKQLESLVAQSRGSLFSLRLFGRGRDVLALGD